jgi:hypothetical protein
MYTDCCGALAHSQVVRYLDGGPGTPREWLATQAVLRAARRNWRHNEWLYEKRLLLIRLSVTKTCSTTEINSRCIDCVFVDLALWVIAVFASYGLSPSA